MLLLYNFDNSFSTNFILQKFLSAFLSISVKILLEHETLKTTYQVQLMV